MQISCRLFFADCSEVVAYTLVGSPSFFPVPFAVFTVGGERIIAAARYFTKLIVSAFTDTPGRGIYACRGERIRYRSSSLFFFFSLPDNALLGSGENRGIIR